MELSLCVSVEWQSRVLSVSFLYEPSFFGSKNSLVVWFSAVRLRGLWSVVRVAPSSQQVLPLT